MNDKGRRAGVGAFGLSKFNAYEACRIHHDVLGLRRHNDDSTLDRRARQLFEERGNMFISIV